ncbi:hypothetical protein EV182_000949 [Spiromyces aspiralis]|uniref:Uncharacterized protein n=1 Tax=Spiromyces aspiralis TaxID=68401 RepID=A0ACC1HIP8_9FUNG|nr:hypothetical protein EV182_000949 [Spiromyces aspiralis]
MSSVQVDGADTNEQLLALARSGQADAIENLLKSSKTFDPSHTDGVGNMAIHYAAQLGHVECLQLLASIKGLDINRPNRLEGNTPLHKAVSYPDERTAHEMAKILIKHGADTRLENRLGQRPIDMVPRNNAELRKTLLLATAALNMPKSMFASNIEDSDGSISDGSE